MCDNTDQNSIPSEGILRGFGASPVNIPTNGVQGTAGIVIGVVLITVFEKQNITKLLK